MRRAPRALLVVLACLLLVLQQGGLVHLVDHELANARARQAAFAAAAIQPGALSAATADPTVSVVAAGGGVPGDGDTLDSLCALCAGVGGLFAALPVAPVLPPLVAVRYTLLPAGDLPVASLTNPRQPIRGPPPAFFSLA